MRIACIRSPPSCAREQSVVDLDELLDLADEAGLLLELAECGVRRRLAEVEPAARQRPDVADADRRIGCGTAGPGRRSSRHDRIGGDTDAVAPLTARAGRRGTADRARATPGRGRPSRGPSSHGRRVASASRRAAYSNRRGPGEERLDEPRDGVLRREPAAHRAVVGVGRTAAPCGSPAAERGVDRAAPRARSRPAPDGGPRR